MRRTIWLRDMVRKESILIELGRGEIGKFVSFYGVSLKLRYYVCVGWEEGIYRYGEDEEGGKQPSSSPTEETSEYHGCAKGVTSYDLL